MTRATEQALPEAADPKRWQRAGHTVTELGHDAIGLIGAVAQGGLGMFFYHYAEPGKL